jgi:hypothetical protein
MFLATFFKTHRDCLETEETLSLLSEGLRKIFEKIDFNHFSLKKRSYVFIKNWNG